MEKKYFLWGSMAVLAIVVLSLISGFFVQMQQAVAKWNGVLPTVVGGSGVLPLLGNLAAPAQGK